ncbi:MAG: preprotein translocase subunit Sec61beta [Euryarchaeota archaeon]|nr:preprotein translocase subunit Sec61beta [Euryarchaeota archaeon]
MPASGAGLIRYMEEEGKGIKFKPEHVLFAAVGVIIFELLLKIGLI